MLDAAADFIARHAVLVLSITVVVTLALSAILWRAVEKLGPRAWSFALTVWEWARTTAVAQWLRRVPGLRVLVSSTLTVARYLGLVAVLGFAVAVGAIVSFLELADEIGIGESLATFDAALSDALRRHLPRETLQVFSTITHLGDAEFLAVLCGIVLVVLFAARKRLLAVAWLVATISGGLLNQLLKEIFQRSRPIHEHGLVSETSWSFPSGHASGSMLVYGLLAYLLVRHTSRAWHIPVALIALAFIFFVGSSRVFLQVHYFSDVLAGYASAGAWVAICIGALEAVRWRDQSRITSAGADPSGANPPSSASRIP